MKTLLPILMMLALIGCAHPKPMVEEPEAIAERLCADKSKALECYLMWTNIVEYRGQQVQMLQNQVNSMPPLSPSQPVPSPMGPAYPQFPHYCQTVGHTMVTCY